jgi:RsmE family RNA methyltransferase
MNLLLFPATEERITLDSGDPRLEHVRGVLRLQQGDSFAVGAANGPLGEATVEQLQPLTLRIVWQSQRPPPPPDIHLLVGMSRPATMRKILNAAPTLGLRRITVADCGRSDPAYARASLWHSKEWQTLLWAGVEQAFDTYVPEVSHGIPLADAVASLPPTTSRVALDVYAPAAQHISTLPAATAEPRCLAIGPERGWNRNDRALLQAAGFRFVHMGRRVMRVETAVVAGLACLLHAAAGQHCHPC